MLLRQTVSYNLAVRVCTGIDSRRIGRDYNNTTFKDLFGLYINQLNSVVTPISRPMIDAHGMVPRQYTLASIYCMFESIHKIVDEAGEIISVRPLTASSPENTGFLKGTCGEGTVSNLHIITSLYINKREL